MADLNNMDAEIKKIKETTESNLSLLASQRKIQESLLYSAKTRKTYTNALTAAAEIQRDLTKKEREQESALKSNSGALIAHMKNNKKLKIEQEKLVKVQKNLKGTYKKNSEEYKKNKKLINEYHKSIKESEEAIKSYQEAMEGNVKTAKDLRSNSKGLKKIFEDVAKVEGTRVSSQDELNDLTSKRLDLLKAEYSIYEKRGDLTSDEAKDLKEQLDSAEEMHKIQGDLIKRGVPEKLSPMVDDIGKSAEELTNQKKFKKNPKKELGRARTQAEYKTGFSLKKEQAESLKSIFSTKTSFKEKLGVVKSYGSAKKGLEDLGSVMGATGKSAKGAGAMFKMLGSALGSLGKLGWIGLAITAITKIADAVNRLDKFTTGFNQTFAKLQGPTVMMGDVKKSMAQFSASIFDLQRNLKYGIDSKEVTGMFQSIAESGMSLQGILNRVSGGYNEVIEKAAQVHIDFGVSMEEAGGMLGEQMTDLKASLDEASDSFKILSYDASIAGIQSQKFYQATYAAAEGLSYYGKFLNSASNTLKDFQKKGGMGFKDAQANTQTLTNMFKNMDDTQRIAFMEMSGGVESYRKDFLKLEKDSKDAVTKHLSNLETKRKELAYAKNRGDKKAIADIEAQIKAEDDMLTNAQKTMAMAGTAAKANIMDMSTYLELLSDKAGEKLNDYFKELRNKQGLDVFSEENILAMERHMNTVIGVPKEFARQMTNTLRTTKVGIEQMAKNMQGLVDTLPDDRKSTFGKDMQMIIESSMKDGKMNMYDLKIGLEQYGKAAGIETSQIYEYLDKFPNAMQEFIRTGSLNVLKNIGKITLDENKKVEKVYETGIDDQNKRINDIVKGTHSIEEIMGIQGEYLEYYAASSDPQQALADAAKNTAMGVGSILNHITTRWPITGGEKARDYKVEQLLYESKKLKLKKEEATDVDVKAGLDNQIKRMEFQARALSKGDQSRFARADIKAAAKIAAEESDRIKGGEAKKEADKRAAWDAKFAATQSVPVQNDYKARSGGYALLSKGDVVVNAKSMASGVGGDLGAFAGTAASELIRSMPSKFSGGAAPQIPVNITIGSVSGDPEQFLNRIKPAIEQTFEKMYYEKQKRR